MSNQMVMVDSDANYSINEAATVAVALFWVIGLGSVLLASIILCGWRGAKQVTFDWMRLKATFYCR